MLNIISKIDIHILNANNLPENYSNDISIIILIGLFMAFSFFYHDNNLPITISENFINYSKWTTWEHSFAQIWLFILLNNEVSNSYSMEEILSTISEVLFNNYIDKTFKSIGVIDVKNLKDIINYLEINVIKKNLKISKRLQS